jgi:hypothetical protein
MPARVSLLLSGELAAAMLGAVDVAYWHVVSFRCAAEFGRHGGIGDIDQAARIKLDL